MEGWVAAIVVMGSMGAIALMVYAGITLVNAWQMRLTGGSAEVKGQLDVVKERLERLEAESVDSAEHEELVSRLAEAEERLDFAERLLGQADARAQLPSGNTSGEVTPQH